MSTSDWIAVCAVAIAALSLGVSGWAIVYARSSAKSNEVMAEANRVMAAEAVTQRALVADQRREEKDQVHRELAPQVPDRVEAVLERDESGHSSLWGTITLGGNKAYRPQAEGIFTVGGGSTPLSFPFLLEPGEHRIPIESWAPDQEEPKIGTVVVKFWPPVAGDDADVWACPCGQPTAETASQGGKTQGHWTRRIKVVFDPPPKPATAPAEPPSAESRRRFFRPNKRLDI
jgi:hypothetical protein